MIPFALLDRALTSPHALALTQQTETHDPALRFVDQLVSLTTDEDLIVAIVGALLPEGYEGNTLDEVPGMIRDAIAKGFDSPQGSATDEKQSAAAMRLAEDQDVHLFHTDQHQAFISLPLRGGGRRAFPVRSENTKAWLRLLYWKAKGKPIATNGLTEVIDTLSARALFDSPADASHLRVGHHNDVIFIDLGDETGECARITADGWTVSADCPVHFHRPNGFGVLPRPTRGGNLLLLKELLGLDENNWALFLAFIINCLRPDGPFMLLLVEGQQGSGKSFLCEVVKRLVDPNAIEKLRLPKKEQDLMIQASENALLVFDNASSMKWDMSDALCALATGSGFSTRKLYSDADSSIFKNCRPVVINGIGEFVHRPDLLERSILLELPSMPVEMRKTEQELRNRFNEILPGVLGRLYDIVATALRRHTEVPLPRNVRMADVAQWIAAAEPATGFEEGSLIRALVEAQEEMMVEKAILNPLIMLILELLVGRDKRAVNAVLEMTVGDLHRELSLGVDGSPRWFPATPAHMSTELKRLAPIAAQIGVHIELAKRTRKGKPVIIRVEGELPVSDVDRTRYKY